MFQRGSYRVQKGGRKENSFKVCLCLLLTVASLFLMIALIGFLFGNFRGQYNATEKPQAEDFGHHSLYGSAKKTTLKTTVMPTTTSIVHKYENVIVEKKKTPSEVEGLTTISNPYFVKTKQGKMVARKYDEQKFTTTPYEWTTRTPDILETTVNKDLTHRYEYMNEEKIQEPKTEKLSFTISSTTNLEDEQYTASRYTPISKHTTSTTATETIETTKPTFGNMRMIMEPVGQTTAINDFESNVKHLEVTQSTTTTSTNQPQEMPKCPAPPPVCGSLACKKSVGRMFALIDHSVDHCEDFYKYACGGIELNRMAAPNSELDAIGIVSDFDELEDGADFVTKIKEFFSSCVVYKNGKGLADAGMVVKSLSAGIAVKDTNKKEALTDIIINILMSHPHESSSRLMPLFDVVLDIGPDRKLIPRVTLPSYESVVTAADGGDIYERDCRLEAIKFSGSENDALEIYNFFLECLSNQTSYMKNMEKAITLLQLFDHLPDYHRTQEIKKTLTFIEWDVYDLMGSLSSFEKLKLTRLRRFDNSSSTDKDYTIHEVSQLYPEINWKRMLDSLFKMDFAVNTIIRLSFRDHLEKIFKFYRTYTINEIKTSLEAMIAHDMYIDFVKPLNSKDRREYCQKLTFKLMADAASSIYMSKFRSKDRVNMDKVARQIYNQTTQRLIASIENVNWLSSHEKSNLISKLDTIKLHTIGADTSDEFTNQQYSLLFLTNNFVTNVMNLKRNIRRLLYNSLGKDAKSSEYLWTQCVTPMTPTPYTNQQLEIIVVPLAVIAKSVLRGKNALQEYEEYAKLGFMIGREIALFFDTIHIRQILKKENEVFKVFVEVRLADPEFAKTENSLNLKISKKDIVLSVDNRFGDDSGIRLARETYETFNVLSSDLPFLWVNQTISQLFYLTLSQQFCEHAKPLADYAIDLFRSNNLPNHFRVNSILMNSHNFAQTFDCPIGSTMNPDFKVDQFPYITSSEVDYMDTELDE